MKITRLPQDTVNHKGRVIAAIEADEVQNGQRVYYVVLERYMGMTGMSYRTQRVNWYPREVDEFTTKWEMEFAEGHGDWIGAEGREKAMRDMIDRAYPPMMKWEKELLNRDENAPEIRTGTYRITPQDHSKLVVDARMDSWGILTLDQTDTRTDETDPSNDVSISLTSTEQGILRQVLAGECNPDILNMDGTTTPDVPKADIGPRPGSELRQNGQR